jgi:hypothetical protein
MMQPQDPKALSSLNETPTDQDKVKYPASSKSFWSVIKKNPWKTAGLVLLAAAYPVGTIIAAGITLGVVINRWRKNRKAKAAAQHAATNTAKPPSVRGKSPNLEQAPSPDMAHRVAADMKQVLTHHKSVGTAGAATPLLSNAAAAKQPRYHY